MKKLYEKNEIAFVLVWIGLYVLVMNIALQFCGGFDHLEEKTVPQLLVPVAAILTLSVLATAWVLRNGLAHRVGLCAFRGKGVAWLYFLPLVVISCVNLKNGLALTAPMGVSVLMAVNMAAAGYLEELIFRGFLFRAMEKDGLKTAVAVSALTFGAGHIVNLLNTEDTLGVLLQVCYAVTIGLMYTVIVFKGGSLWPCVLSHMCVNATSVFAPEEGPFTDLVTDFLGRGDSGTVQTVSAVLIMALSTGYAWWLWKRVPDPRQ